MSFVESQLLILKGLLGSHFSTVIRKLTQLPILIILRLPFCVLCIHSIIYRNISPFSLTSRDFLGGEL